MARYASAVVIGVLVILLGCPGPKKVGVGSADPEHDNVCIDLSPDGKSVVFSSASGDLYLFDLAQSTVTRLTATERIESYPSFSPDGNQLVFTAKDSEKASARIYTMNLSDRSESLVTQCIDQSDALPRFTPDGRCIVFARAFRKRPYSLGGEIWDQWEVCTIELDGTAFHQVTNVGYYQLFRIVPLTDDAFMYAADSLGDEAPAALYKLARGGQPERVVPSPGTIDSNVHAWASDPMISFDGKLIAYCSDRFKPFWYDVCLHGGESGAKSLVGETSRYNRYPDFFPDGQRILFLAGTKFNQSSRPIYSLWEVSLSGETREIASSDLFTNPDDWRAP